MLSIFTVLNNSKQFPSQLFCMCGSCDTKGLESARASSEHSHAETGFR